MKKDFTLLLKIIPALAAAVVLFTGCPDGPTEPGPTGTGTANPGTETTETGGNGDGDTGTSTSEGVIFVRSASTSGQNNGATWADAYISLHAALDAAESGDQIWVANGTYYPESSHDEPEPNAQGRSNHFRLKNGVELYGGFVGNEDNLDDRDFNPLDWGSDTIISGDIGIPDDDGDNVFHVFYHPEGLNLDHTAVLDGFRITGGAAGFDHGGAMYNEGSSPLIRNCYIEYNSAYFGGAIYNADNSIRIVGTTFSGNYSDNGSGGAIYNVGSDLEIVECDFSYNRARGGTDGSNGGAICSRDGTVRIVDSEFGSNQGYRGGAVYSYESETVIIDSRFVRVSDPGNNAYYGGAVCLENSTGTDRISGTLFEFNQTTNYSDARTGYGGAIRITDAELEITNSIFVKNDALYGAAISAYASDASSPSQLTVIQSAFSVNRYTERGGALRMTDTDVNIVNCSFYRNGQMFGLGSEEGQTIYKESGSLNVVNSIFYGWANTSPNYYIYPPRGDTSVTYSSFYPCSENNLPAGDGNINIQLSYESPEYTPYDFRLTSASAEGIDAGTNAPYESGGIAEDISEDFYGNERIVGGTVDMGATEYDPDNL